MDLFYIFLEANCSNRLELWEYWSGVMSWVKLNLLLIFNTVLQSCHFQYEVLAGQSIAAFEVQILA